MEFSNAKALAKATYIYVATVRKDGTMSKAAALWFIATADNCAIIETSPKSWKARRFKRGSPAIVWIGSRKGPAFIGRAEVVTDVAIQDRAIDGFPQKYWLARLGLARPSRAKLDRGQIVFICISPLRDMPELKSSAPGVPAPKLD